MRAKDSPGDADSECQHFTGGGLLRRWDGTWDTGTYDDDNTASSYCWKFGFGDGGIDLQNDGNGHRSASTRDVGQQPFVMLVR
jgi:hypothetical protein